MNDKIPTITPQGIDAAVENSSSTKSVDEITAETRNQYVATGSETAQPAEGRKKRRDAGMPRGPRKSLGTDTTSRKNGVGADGQQTPSYTLDKAIVEKTVKSVVGAIDGVLVRKIGQTSFALTKDLEFSKGLASEAGLTLPEVDLMGELTAIIFEKYGLLSGYAPEILLGITVSGWGIRVTLVMKKLNALAEEARKKQAKERKDDGDVSAPSPR